MSWRLHRSKSSLGKWLPTVETTCISIHNGVRFSPTNGLTYEWTNVWIADMIRRWQWRRKTKFIKGGRLMWKRYIYVARKSCRLLGQGGNSAGEDTLKLPEPTVDSCINLLMISFTSIVSFLLIKEWIRYSLKLCSSDSPFVRDSNKVSYHRRGKSVDDEGCLHIISLFIFWCYIGIFSRI